MNVQILADSINGVTGNRLTTFLLNNFPKCLLAEFNTHRIVSRNWESSRARPIKSVIAQVKNNPFISTLSLHQKGMSGIEEVTTEQIQEFTESRLLYRDLAVKQAELELERGYSKQVVNRILEPFMRVSGIVSATEWHSTEFESFFTLRTHKDTDPDFRKFAVEMRIAYDASEPKELDVCDWHLPYEIVDKDCDYSPSYLAKASGGKCARVSYAQHSLDKPVSSHVELCEHLISSSPRHLSPLEHQARAVSTTSCVNTRNYKGFYQYRSIIEDFGK